MEKQKSRFAFGVLATMLFAGSAFCCEIPRDTKMILMSNLPYEFEGSNASAKQLPINAEGYTFNLFVEAEKLFGHKVVFRKTESVINADLIAENSTSDVGLSGKIPYQIVYFTIGAVIDGKIPVIEHSIPLKEFSEDVICHEVLHLLMAGKSGIYHSGYASPLYDHLIRKIPNEALLFNVFSHANSILQHTYIFKKMHKAGFRLKDSFERFTNSGNSYPSYANECSFYHIAIDTWHLLAGEKDGLPAIARTLKRIETGFPESFELGKKMYSISNTIESPTDISIIFKKILAELFQYPDKINFQKGNTGSAYNLGVYY